MPLRINISRARKPGVVMGPVPSKSSLEETIEFMTQVSSVAGLNCGSPFSSRKDTALTEDSEKFSAIVVKILKTADEAVDG